MDISSAILTLCILERYFCSNRKYRCLFRRRPHGRIVRFFLSKRKRHDPIGAKMHIIMLKIEAFNNDAIVVYGHHKTMLGRRRIEAAHGAERRSLRVVG